MADDGNRPGLAMHLICSQTVHDAAGEVVIDAENAVNIGAGDGARSFKAGEIIVDRDRQDIRLDAENGAMGHEGVLATPCRIGHMGRCHHRRTARAVLDQQLGGHAASRLVVIDHTIDKGNVVALVDQHDRYPIGRAFLAQRRWRGVRGDDHA